MLAPSCPANARVATSINKYWRQVDPPMQRSRPLLINGAPSWPANAAVATSINKCWRQVDPSTPRSRPLLINVCQHTVDESTIQSTRAGLGRHHLAFAVANCVLNQRFAVATVGSCDELPAKRKRIFLNSNHKHLILQCLHKVAESMWARPVCFYFNCHFFCTTATNRDLRQKAVYIPAGNQRNFQRNNAITSDQRKLWKWRDQMHHFLIVLQVSSIALVAYTVVIQATIK